ncbi:FIGL1 [Enterospora canceri]|uniref:FIGL1 n=1 Tax=Enterospora canceri TaxID=1081671 RepID=A0A1Y1S8T1_9MICR|nr:FIGL1 [Enterospora canceri]
MEYQEYHYSNPNETEMPPEKEKSRLKRVFNSIKKNTHLITKTIVCFLVILLALAIGFGYSGVMIGRFPDAILETVRDRKLAKLTSTKHFEQMEGNLFREIKYQGKKEDMEKQLRLFIPNIYRLNTQTQEQVKDTVVAESFGTFMLGPPGTGKTLYVKRLCYLMDLELKEMYSLHKDGKKLNKYTPNTLTDNRIKELDKMVSRVHLIVIRPSDINNKYVGESEKRVRKLFQDIKVDKDPYMATFVFFDEAESLFTSRANRQDDSVTAGTMTEFLTQFSDMRNVIYPVFFFAATNMSKQIDSAIFTRFSNKVNFKMPTIENIQGFLDNRLSAVKTTGRFNINVQQLAQICTGLAYSIIDSVCSKFTNMSYDGKVTGFDWAKAKEFTRNYKEMTLRDGVDAEEEN